MEEASSALKPAEEAPELRGVVELKKAAEKKKARCSNLPPSTKEVGGGSACSRRPEPENGGHGMIQVCAGAHTVLSKKKGGRPVGRPPDKVGGG